MGKLGKITGMMVSPKKAQQKMKDFNNKVGRAALIKGLPKCIQQGYKEQKTRGIIPTVDSIFGEINKENLDFYHKMDINDEHIKNVIKEVLDKESINER